MTDPLSLIPDANFAKHKAGKFASKLTDAERCAVLALLKVGVRRDRIAAAYLVDRRTITHVGNDASPHYKKTRRHYAELGHDEFIKRYLTEEVAAKIAALPEDKADEPVADKDPNAPNVRSNRMAGMQKVPIEEGLRAFEHTVEIKYLKKGESEFEGWHYRDLDSSTPNDWFHNGDESRVTSHACYDAVKENLTDD